MGFRSVFMTADNAVHWPSWFVQKYQDVIEFSFSRKGIFYSPTDIKLYREDLVDLPEDIRKAIDWDKHDYMKELLIVILHECGGVTRLHITRDSIRWSEPTEWEEVEGITHHDCLYCSKI